MNLTTASRTFQLLTRLLDTRSRTEPFLPPNGEKKPLPLRLPQQPFPRATPESQGVSSDHIRKFLEELARGEDPLRAARTLVEGYSAALEAV